MATPAMLVTLQSVYAQALVPEQLVVYLTETLQLQTVENFVNYVVKSEYEAEWRDIIQGAFPVKQDMWPLWKRQQWRRSQISSDGSGSARCAQLT